MPTRTNGEEVKVGLRVLSEFCRTLDSVPTVLTHEFKDVGPILKFVESLSESERVGLVAVYHFSRRISSLLR